jgi:hypothetical protein
MMVGNGLDEVGESSSSSNSTALPGLELDRDDPTRTNYCGIDWSDAISNCDDDSHWCPDGTDEECPDGKICFAGTDCKYESDLVPTGSPIIPPSAAPTPEPLPTQSPVMYNAPENSHFCGTGWENVRTTCRIGSHCPSKDHAECPSGQQCLGWIQGCNIIDFKKHLQETGKEIFGSDHWLLPVDVDLPGLVDVNSTEAEVLVEGLPPPDNILAALGVQAEAATAATTLMPTSSLDNADANAVAAADSSRYKDGTNHIFCGVSWLDASTRCSPETFCLNGATMHVCSNATEYCFVGVTACDANEWIFPTASPTTTTSLTTTTSTPTLVITTEESNNNIIDSASPTQSVTSELSSTDNAADEISFLMEGQDNGGDDNNEENMNDDNQVDEKTDDNVITVTPTASPSSISTEIMSIEQTVDEENVDEIEVATSTIVQSYCAMSYVDVVTNCQELNTCNKNEECLDGYTCFTNVECTVEVFEVPFEGGSSSSPTSTPSMDMQIESFSSQSEVFEDSSASPTSYMTTIQPTLYPISMTPTTTTSQGGSNSIISPHFYCATSLDEISCSASPTCDDETMCPSGMFCFEVPTCYDGSSSDDFWANTYSITTTSPSTLSPSTFPTTLRPITTSESPTYYLRSSSLRPTSSATNTAIVPGSRIQNYCAPSEDELLSLAPGTSNTPLCAVTNTCNDELQMCPPGTYCFVNYSCPLEISTEGGGAVMTVVIPDSSTEKSEVSIASNNREETQTNSTQQQQPWEIDWEPKTIGDAPIDDTRVADDLEAYWLLKENNSTRSVASLSITVMLGLMLLLDILQPTR